MAGTAKDLRAAGALETADLVRRGEVSALEVCEAAIDRIERLDNEINAVVVKDYERARAAAMAIDQTRAPDDARPLLGVAMTVKESNNIRHLQTTWGFEDFKGWCPPADAIAVERLKAAGAVILGKTNAPVALADWQSFNPVYGRTSNPHDLSRTPGGSSGGSAAALAAGMVPLEVGSDIGGSIRAPAHFCGVFGHKPTYGVVPMRGHGFPGSDGLDVPLAVVGPLARRADDLGAAFDIIAGSATPGWRLDLPKPRPRLLSDYRVLVLPLDGLPRVASDVWRPIQLLAEALEDAGAEVERFSGKLPDIMALHENYVRMVTSVTMRGAPDARPMDVHKWFEAQDLQLDHKRAWAALFEDFDIVLAPIASMTAFPHADRAIWFEPDAIVDGEPVRYGTQLVWAGLATYSELPATAIPLAITPDGLPTGVQALGPAAGDLTTLRFAELVEAAGLSLDPTANFPA